MVDQVIDTKPAQTAFNALILGLVKQSSGKLVLSRAYEREEFEKKIY